ncbi:MAG: hypothetical protein IJ214_00725 [Clostridia bacterium]|nr:hypothetical protein [Clostridia bacterium]
MSRKAVIVIGSNSTRCIAADPLSPDDQTMRRRVETRLFLHMRDGFLSEDAIAETIAGIRSLADQANAPVLGIYATSAVRDARNAVQLARAIETACGIPLTVLSGEEEAAASFYGAAGDKPAGMIDIGGGSTEIATGRNMRVGCTVSLQLGASRLFAVHPVNRIEDAVPALTAAVNACQQIPPALARHDGIDHFYSVGGTGTACACLMQGVSRKKAQVEGHVLRRDDVFDRFMTIAGIPRDQRGAIPGFPVSRADILPTGMAILLAVMDKLKLNAVTVTERTNGDGLLLVASQQKYP